MNFSGRVRKKFYFPSAPLPALEYLADIEAMMTHFEAVSVVDRVDLSTDKTCFRLLYTSTELGVYTVNVFCDVVAQNDPDRFKLELQPLEPNDSPFDPIDPKVEPTQLVTTGEFSLKVEIVEESLEKSIVDYDLTINTLIELGDVLGFIVRQTVTQIVLPMLNSRLDAIVLQFIKNAVTDYRKQKRP